MAKDRWLHGTRPIFIGDMRMTRGEHALEVKPGGRIVLGYVVLILLGVGCIIAIFGTWHLVRGNKPLVAGRVIVGLLGIYLIWIGGWCLCHLPRLWWDAHARELRLRYSRSSTQYDVAIPQWQVMLRAKLMRGKVESAWARAGQVGLYLSGGEAGGETITLAYARYPCVQAFMDAMRAWVAENQLRDETMVYSSEAGMMVSSAPLMAANASFEWMRYRRKGNNALVRGWTWQLYGILGIMLALGAGLLMVAASELRKGSTVTHLLPLVLVGAVFSLVGAIALILCHWRTIMVDGGRNAICICRIGSGVQTEVPVSDVRVLQVCSWWHDDAEGGSYMAYEINAIIEADGRPDRINLLGHGNFSAIEQQLTLLSKFMNLPACNHADD